MVFIFVFVVCAFIFGWRCIGVCNVFKFFPVKAVIFIEVKDKIDFFLYLFRGSTDAMDTAELTFEPA